MRNNNGEKLLLVWKYGTILVCARNRDNAMYLLYKADCVKVINAAAMKRIIRIKGLIAKGDPRVIVL